MQVSGFPDCCGMVVFSGFGHSTTGRETTPFTVEEITNFLEENETYYKNKAMLIATINEEQVSIMKEIFENRGWSKVASNLHEQHNKTIHVYIKILN